MRAGGQERGTAGPVQVLTGRPRWALGSGFCQCLLVAPQPAAAQGPRAASRGHVSSCPWGGAQEARPCSAPEPPEWHGGSSRCCALWLLLEGAQTPLRPSVTSVYSVATERPVRGHESTTCWKKASAGYPGAPPHPAPPAAPAGTVLFKKHARLRGRAPRRPATSPGCPHGHRGEGRGCRDSRHLTASTCRSTTQWAAAANGSAAWMSLQAQEGGCGGGTALRPSGPERRASENSLAQLRSSPGAEQEARPPAAASLARVKTGTQPTSRLQTTRRIPRCWRAPQ